MVEIGLFDAELWKQNILTSKSIQERYLTAKGRYLNEKKLEKQYLLIPLPEIKARVSTVKTPVCTEKTPVITVETPVCTVESAQSIGNKNKVENNKENESINLIERESNARARENDQSLKAEWDQWKMELLNDEDWCATLIRISGKGLSLLDKTHQAMNCFDDINVLRALQNTVQTKKEYQSGFIAWWRHNNWETDMQVLSGAKSAKNKVPPRTEYKKPAARKSRYEEMMEVAAEAKLLTKKMYENNGFGYTIENSLEATTDYTA